MCVEILYLINIVNSLTLNSQTTALKLMSKWSLSDTYIFSVRQAHHNLLTLQNSRQHFSSTLRCCFKQRNHKQKIQKCKKSKCGTKYTWKRLLFKTWELKKKAKRCFVHPHLGMYWWMTHIFCHSVHAHKWPQTFSKYWFGG